MVTQEYVHHNPIRSDIPDSEPVNYDMIVFCHLRWNFVYQRPQHIISRMSEQYNILFIEEPISYGEGEENTAEITIINSRLSVLKPRIDNIADLKFILPMYVANTTVNIGWFYSSAFIPVLNYLTFNIIVYDCMDELTLFKGASELLATQETYLLNEADLVFTGGKSLYEAKKQSHHQVYCFPSSVDKDHFGKASGETDAPADLPKGKPVVGYYGVIDERIDLDLLAAISEKAPDIDFVMIGPVVKIDESKLPGKENIHYLGMKPYKELPQYLQGFNIAMMPFQLNDATKFISPTKTLEFIAAHKPVISTPVNDVIRDYKNHVAVVENAEEFYEAIQRILKRPQEEVLKQEQQYEEILNKTSWDKTVKEMQEILKKQTHE